MTVVGLIHNPRSHRNIGGRLGTPPAGVITAAPDGEAELILTLADFAARGVELLVIDGGDGTVREVISRLNGAFEDRPPRLAILPTGKTNALALDLGASPGWSLESALAAAARGSFETRRPLAIHRDGASRPWALGFVFGAGVYVRATKLAGRQHRLGFIDGLAVALTMIGAAFATLVGGWRQGEEMTVDGEAARRFLVLASGLKRMPLGVKPFGDPREGLKRLVVAAPPRGLLLALPVILKGADKPWLTEAGYVRSDIDAFSIAWDGEFVLDGEVYPAGVLDVRLGAPLEFVAP